MCFWDTYSKRLYGTAYIVNESGLISDTEGILHTVQTNAAKVITTGITGSIPPPTPQVILLMHHQCWMIMTALRNKDTAEFQSDQSH